MDSKTEEIQQAWDQRQQRLGSNQRSVLYKNLPEVFNQSLHKRHSQFIVNNIPPTAHRLLDLGCGYGRLAREVKRDNSEIAISGVELCQAFAEQFDKEFEECFHGSIQSYQPQNRFDVILIVTVLMYVEREELSELLNRYWATLPIGGRIICIEQFDNILIQLRRAFLKNKLQPTGREVHYFQRNELINLLLALPGSKLISQQKFGLLPILNRPVMHTGIVLQKDI